jgi:hypothetical protein
MHVAGRTDRVIIYSSCSISSAGVAASASVDSVASSTVFGSSLSLELSDSTVFASSARDVSTSAPSAPVFDVAGFRSSVRVDRYNLLVDVSYF